MLAEARTQQLQAARCQLQRNTQQRRLTGCLSGVQVQGAGPLFQASWVSSFVSECCNNDSDPAVVTSGQWAAEQIAKAA